ncbi:2-dehydropantoate 2-reductase N-terminal domain-containing protein, partial [Acinetobacter baumannii]
GAGAVGCYYGAMLARAGHEVVLVGRPAFAAHVGAHGLRLQHVDFDVSLSVEASADPAALAGAEVVLFTVKSTDTPEAGAALAAVLPAQAVV